MNYKNERKAIFLELEQSSKALLQFRKRLDWENIARSEQKMPEGEWWAWLILAGRGFGKTRTGSESIRSLIKLGYRRICLLGATFQEVRRVMVEGESGILTVARKDGVRYHPSRGVLIWPNGAEAQLFSAENPESMRGPQFDAAWIDEFMKFDSPKAIWDQLMMTLRLGSPRLIITSTPRPLPILKEIMSNKTVIVTRGTTLDNSENLPQTFLDSVLTQYGETPFARQEIYGEVLDNTVPLWSKSCIKYFEEMPVFDQVIVSIDPAVSNNINSDETGIIVIGKSKESYYVIEDSTFRGSAIEWTQQAIKLYYHYRASTIIIETNQGGELSKTLLSQLDPKVAVHEVRASKSKYVRAQSASILYFQGLVFHAKHLYDLEYQMLNFEQLSNSPDRVDALVWGLQFLNQPSCKAYVF